MSAVQQYDITPVLEKLIRKENLSLEEAQTVADHLANGELSQVQITAFLVLLRAKGESGEELLAMAQAMRRRATIPDPLPSSLSSLAPLVDIVGTGGDGHDTVNLSTASAIVASACGARVAKHGNRSASSKSGSADVLEALGVPMLDAFCVGECIDRAGIAFLFAPNFHPAMGPVAPLRKQLGIKTVFNILGPLLNPLEPKRMVLGVYAPHLLPIYAQAVSGLGVEHALIVHCCGLDELASVGIAEAVEIKGTSTRTMQIDSQEFCAGPYGTIADLKGGDAAHNAQVLRVLLGGGGGVELKACFDTICLNAGAVLFVSGLAKTMKDGVNMAAEAMKTSRALRKLEELAKVAQDLHGRVKKVKV